MGRQRGPAGTRGRKAFRQRGSLCDPGQVSPLSVLLFSSLTSPVSSMHRETWNWKSSTCSLLNTTGDPSLKTPGLSTLQPPNLARCPIGL